MATYRINDIFYSLQGEGRWAGTPAIFIRFSGCNLKCPFCDTNFQYHIELTSRQIADRAKQLSSECNFVVLTGGEPSLQIDTELLDMLRRNNYKIAIETNGTHELPKEGIDWVTVSPKNQYVDNGELVLASANEVKVVFSGLPFTFNSNIVVDNYYLQPCDTGDSIKNAQIVSECVEYIKQHPKWKLSLQQQKILNIE
jgi:organic radical activating enzyme